MRIGSLAVNLAFFPVGRLREGGGLPQAEG